MDFDFGYQFTVDLNNEHSRYKGYEAFMAMDNKTRLYG